MRNRLDCGPRKSAPVMLASCERRVLMSIAIPRAVLITESPSAPASSAARAMTVISVTFGESLTSSGRAVFSLTPLTSSSVNFGSTPKLIPPEWRFGQEMLSSIAATPSAASNFSVTSKILFHLLTARYSQLSGTSKLQR